MIIFDTKDVLTLAKAIKENAEYIEESTYGRDEYACRFCDSRLSTRHDVYKYKHSLDCPYLISLDVLTVRSEKA